jgi:OOP family OmpA-OmpF porin
MQAARASVKLGLLALTIIAAPMVSAQDSGWYLGANVGQSKSKIDDAQITNSLLRGGLATTSMSDRDHDTGFKVFGGYQFNKYFAFEGGYFDLGKFGFTSNTLPAGTLNGDLKVNGFNFDAVLSLPFTKKFSGFLRAGVINADTKDTFAGTGAVVVLNPNPTKRETNYKYGAGLQYDFTRSFGMRAEVERYRINDAVGNKGDVDLASVGVLFKFGRKAPMVASYTPAPEPYVAPAPVVVETPVAVVVPAPAQSQQYCTVLNLTFDIDRDNIERDDKEKLKVVGTFLTKYPATTAVIEGHTDNVGTPEHNMKLSLARAESVVTYLVNDIHIDRARLKAVGYGNTNPLNDNTTEEGKRENRRINAVIACVDDIEGLTVAPARITVALDIEFDSKKDEVLPAHKEELRKVANFMKANPSVTATVEGHAGQLVEGQDGLVKVSAPEAMAISKRRAENVVTYLVDNFGIARSRLTAEGFGKTRRYAYSTTAEGRQENRRINILINYPKK